MAGSVPSRRPPGGLPHGRSWAEFGKVGERSRRGPPTSVRAVGLRQVDGMALESQCTCGVGGSHETPPTDQRQESAADTELRDVAFGGSRSVRRTTANKSDPRREVDLVSQGYWFESSRRSFSPPAQRPSPSRNRDQSISLRIRGPHQVSPPPRQWGGGCVRVDGLQTVGAEAD